MSVIERLVQRSSEIAVKSATEYLRVHSLKADSRALAECLRSWLKAKLPEAMHDAREAIEAGMHEVAEQTFSATVALAGIEAAKEAGFPS